MVMFSVWCSGNTRFNIWSRTMMYVAGSNTTPYITICCAQNIKTIKISV